ncbi:MAG: aminodeoxychorismate synthase component I [Chloroflexi bacterium]|nr:aminodeoxychorismate synthase component I [Chloroflexota bacterium]
MLPRAAPFDGVTPLAAWQALADAPYVAWLDSALVDGRLGRYSYLMAEPFGVLQAKGRRVELCWQGGRREVWDDDPFVAAADLLRRLRRPARPDLPPFQGGAVGYWGYELAHHLERLPRAEDDLALPDLHLAFYDSVLAWDHLSGACWAVANGGPAGDPLAAERRLAETHAWLAGLRSADDAPAPLPPPGPPTSTFSRASYLRAVERVKEHLACGDVYQVNLTQRFAVRPTAGPRALYARLRALSAAPFGAYLDCGDLVVLSASPELFLRLDGEVIETRPMKGTRPRGRTPVEDAALADELGKSAKDRAENVMIVDLLRNDLGRICQVGSVHVPELFVVETYPTVHQLVSTVCGRLRPDLAAFDALRSCLPGGSVTGAPKVRAMGIITALERVVRGVYCGAIGYVGFDGAMLTSVAIRTTVLVGGQAYVQVGGGIVADSDPAAEYAETLDKARGTFAALGIPQCSS